MDHWMPSVSACLSVQVCIRAHVSECAVALKQPYYPEQGT